MKVGLVYTSTTPELIEMVEDEVKNVLGDDVETISFQDPSILAEVRDNEYVTAKATARLVNMYMDCVNEDADAILNICSSVGEVGDAVQDIAKFTGIPIVRIDEEMCREAVRMGKKIGVMATLKSTLDPTKDTIKRVAREMNKRIILVDGLIEGAFGLDQEEFKIVMINKAMEIKDDIDVILFAQGSMAYCEEIIHEKTDKPVVSSPKYGAKALKQALVNKGLI